MPLEMFQLCNCQMSCILILEISVSVPPKNLSFINKSKLLHYEKLVASSAWHLPVWTHFMLWQHFQHQLQHLLLGMRSQLCISICLEMAKARKTKGNSCLVLKKRLHTGSCSRLQDCNYCWNKWEKVSMSAASSIHCSKAAQNFSA